MEKLIVDEKDQLSGGQDQAGCEGPVTWMIKLELPGGFDQAGCEGSVTRWQNQAVCEGPVT